MTPSGFAKLSLRLLSLYVLWVAFKEFVLAAEILRQRVLDVSNPDVKVTGPFVTNLVISLGQAGVMAIGAAVLWYRSGALAGRLLPAGIGTDPGADYPVWQRIGLMFAGGLICLQGLSQFIGDFGDYFLMYQAGSVAQMLFAAVLIIGASDVAGILARLFGGRRTPAR